MFNRFSLILNLSFLCFLLLGIYSPAKAQDHSPLAQGQWHKIGISQEGVYKLSYQFLQRQGMISSATDPANIRIYGQGGGMLPQANAAARPDGLQENAIFVSGQDNGRFDPQDYILFYAQGPDHISYQDEKNKFHYQKNIYSDTVYYFFSVAEEKGLRISAKENISVSQPLIKEYTAYAAFEEDKVKLLASSTGRNWLGDRFGNVNSKTYELPVRHIAAEGQASIEAAFVGTSTTASRFKVSLNDQPALSLELPPIMDPRKHVYADKGVAVTQEAQISTAGFSRHDRLSIRVDYEGSFAAGGAYIDYLFATLPAELRYEGRPLFFRSPESMQQPVAGFEIQGAQQGLELWDLSQPQQPSRQKYSLNNRQLAFGTSSGGQLREFVLFNPAEAPEPLTVSKVARQNLRAELSAELLIITHPSLMAEAERLADFRRRHDGLDVKVATTTQVYNEFSSGAQDVSAIRDYARHLYVKGGRLRYLLLFGRAYFDYKHRTDKNFNMVPMYQSYNSTHPILSYSSDDYYGFLQEEEGSWQENAEGNHQLDIGIGRLPVVDLSEARAVVDKLIRYQSSKEALGNWRNKLLFIAEDGDNNIHHRDSERLAELVKETWPIGNINKIYLGAYPEEKTPTGVRSPQAREAINAEIEQGALLVNYTGHGSQDQLTKKRVITRPIIDQWKNKDRLPLVVTATCDFGQNDHGTRSGAEHMLLNPDGGAIGLFTASSPVYSHTNFEINSAFYAFAFSQDPTGMPQRLGDIIKYTKNQAVPNTGIINRNFILLGDPSMRISHPGRHIEISKLEHEADGRDADTLGAFAQVRARGRVLDLEGKTDLSFNGMLEAVVYEKPVEYETTDPASPAMRFTLQDRLIFRGQATIEEGRFTFGFVVPNSIRYPLGEGKISLYAIDTSSHVDASGEYHRFLIGGSSTEPIADQTPPRITVFLNDSSFRSGQTVGSKSMLMVTFEDESGINITNTGVQEGIVATLDGQSSFLLNDYYLADPDDYTRGRLAYPLHSLEPGPHSLKITARDAYNNIGHSEIHFIVSDHKAFEIYSLGNFPNPFREQTTLVAEHSRAGEDLEATIWIYNLEGRVLHQEKHLIMQSRRRMELMEWDGSSGGKKLPAGLYLFKILLRSLTDGSNTEKSEKLVILN